MPGAPSRLRCEYLNDPLGIDERRPRLSWWVVDPRPAEIQTAYQLIAASSRDALDQDAGDLWDTGRVDSTQFLNVEYGGPAPVTAQRVWWKVRTFDSDGLGSPWSAPAFFEMGLLEHEGWRARWISAPLMGDKRTPVQVPALRRAFELTATVAKARLYVTALGVYDIEINGRRAIDTELAPGWTDYGQRLRYQTYDVTDLLAAGENVIGARLGDGWYCGFVGLADRQNYGDKPELLAQLEVEYADGTRTVLETDHQWKWQRSEIVASDLMRGESVDARQDLGAWSRPGFDDRGWYPVDVTDRTEQALVGVMSPPVRQLATIDPVAEPTRRRDTYGRRQWIYDLGQSIVGRVRVKLNVPRGTLIRIGYAERLNDAGELDPGDADYFTAAGDLDGEVFEPKFAFHGFRYVELSGDFPLDGIGEVVGIVLGSDLELIGTLDCSDELVARLQHNIQWSQRGNFLDVPMGGPHRTQRLGWTGDAQAFARTASFNMDVAAFYAKWLLDLADAVSGAGDVPPIAPLPPGHSLFRFDGGPAWSDAIVICPWTIYRCFGDRRVLERHYPAMRRFVAGLAEKYPDLIRTDAGLDVWQGLGNRRAVDGAARASERLDITPEDLIGTAFFSHSARLLARAAGVLGDLSDMEHFEGLAQRVKAAFRKRFVTGGGRLVGETQTSYVLALHFGLLEDDEREQVIRLLVADIETRGCQLSTEFVGSAYVLHVLTEAGRLDVAYRLLLHTESPGWHANSFYHDSDGAVGEWLYHTCAGLELDPSLAPERNAYRHALIKPHPPLGFSGGPPLTEMNVGLDTVNGRYEVQWQIDEGEFRLRVKVPVACSATLVMPDGETHEVVSGVHAYRMPLAEQGDGIPVLREVTELAS